MIAKQNGSRAGEKALVLPVVPPQDFRILNGFFRHRPPLELRLGKQMLQVSPTWLATEPSIADACTITLKIDDGQGELVMPKSVLNLIFTGLDPSLSFDTLDGAQRAHLLEFALSAAFESLETNLGCALSIVNVAWGAGNHPSLPLSLHIEGLGRVWCSLRLALGDIERLTKFLNRASAKDDGILDVPVPLHVRWASVVLTLGEIRSLAPGDIILVDNACQQPGRAIAVIGEHLTVPVDMMQDGCRLIARPRRAQGTGWEWLLSRQPPAAKTPADARLEEVPALVLFEFGRLDLPLSDVSRLNAGAVLPLAASSGQTLDIILNGERIGSGEATQIGDGIGIRVTRLVHPAGSPNPYAESTFGTSGG